MATKAKPASKPTRREPGDVKAYEVVSPLNHDGEDYAIGDQVELSDLHAAPLLGHTVKPLDEAQA